MLYSGEPERRIENGEPGAEEGACTVKWAKGRAQDCSGVKSPREINVALAGGQSVIKV